ncbi:MAG: hypothetical protein ACPLUL_10540 [Thermanaerothrix sp.]|jgi:hypothetical protein|uniref:Uncharacterized protein n=1 Tax=Thermanaerothrix solaris TaxID=3058434 RepID=A0ABU3NK67_9CHLR|nr:hypothetical protein [Thermanaerothrix sp. 4228-RoL]MDT8897251.1 hypothetical protein [Thermanaerothrix sp. 4228-RoL]
MSKKKKRQVESDPFATGQPWLSMKSAIITMAVVSVLMVAWVTWQGSYSKPLGESLLWGLVFGGSIWIVFLLFLLIHRLFRR